MVISSERKQSIKLHSSQTSISKQEFSSIFCLVIICYVLKAAHIKETINSINCLRVAVYAAVSFVDFDDTYFQRIR